MDGRDRRHHGRLAHRHPLFYAGAAPGGVSCFWWLPFWVTESLARLRATRIVVAHRLSTVMSADRIIVMRDGRVVESGRFDELIGRGGLFSDFAARQQG